MEFVNIYFLALQTIEKFIPKLSAPQIHSLCQRHRRNQWFSRCSHMGTLVTSLYNIAKNNDECAIYMVGIILVANVGILNYKMSHSVISTPKYPNVPIWEHWRHVITLLVGWQIPEMCTSWWRAGWKDEMRRRVFTPYYIGGLNYGKNAVHFLGSILTLRW